MKKEVSNVEKMTKKQQKQFTIVYVIGLVAFIVLMIFLEGRIFEEDESNSLNLNRKLLDTPNVLVVDEDKEKGKELNTIVSSYNVFISEIDDLHLEALSNDKFEYIDHEYKYVNENYTHIATDNSLKLTRKGQEVYSVILEDDLVKIKLSKDNNYYLEYSSREICFKVNNLSYEIVCENNKYIINSNYEVDDYNVVKEIYDLEWNFESIEVKYHNYLFKGYFFNQLEGYLLSEDKMEIINESNNESIPSTKMLEDNITIYYTVMEYKTNEISKDVLLVNSTQKFPLN